MAESLVFGEPWFLESVGFYCQAVVRRVCTMFTPSHCVQISRVPSSLGHIALHFALHLFFFVPMCQIIMFLFYYNLLYSDRCSVSLFLSEGTHLQVLLGVVLVGLGGRIWRKSAQQALFVEFRCTCKLRWHTSEWSHLIGCFCLLMEPHYRVKLVGW